MIKSGTVLYNTKSHKVVVQSSDARNIKTIVHRTTHVSFNNGSQTEKQVFHDKESFPINYIGIYLFYTEADIKKNYRSIIKQSNYSFNKEQILVHYESKHRELIDSIELEAPEQPVTTEELNQVIANYFDVQIQKREEEAFKLITKDKISYFGRMDFSTCYYKAQHKKLFTGNYYDKVYISKDGPLEVGNIKVIDWRSPIGSYYYDNENTEFTHGDTYEYKLILKRSFQHSPFKFHNLFLEGMNLYDEGSVDEFLLKLLHEKRSLHKPTDIIQSIQSNQNKIIRSAPKENLIVQGCAGSGKTMILLHRLSYLLYNKHIVRPSNVIVITPSETFNTFYSDLSTYLELDNIMNYTIEKFYELLIDQYESDYFIKKTKLKVATKNKIIEIVDKEIATVSSFKLSYSDESIRNIRGIYDQFIDSYITKKRIDQIIDIGERFNLNTNNIFTSSNYNKIKAVEALTSKSIISQNNEKKRSCVRTKNECDKKRKELNLLDESITSCNSFLTKMENIVNMEEMIPLQKELSDYNEDIKVFSIKLKDINKIKKNLEIAENTYIREEQALQVVLKKLEKEILDLALQIEKISKLNIFRRNSVKKEKKVKQTQLDKIKNDLEDIKLNYNLFLRRSYESIDTILADNDLKLLDYAMVSVEQLVGKLQKSIIAKRQKLSSILESNELTKFLSSLELYKVHVEPIYKITTDFINNFNDNNHIYNEDVKNVMRIAREIISIKPDLEEYMNLMNQLFKKSRALQSNLKLEYGKYKKISDDMELDYNQEVAKLLTESEENMLEETSMLCIGNHNLIDYLKDSLIESIGLSEELISNQLTKRYKNFINLLLLYLHYGPLRQSKEALFIDEGQNYSINDYRILQRVFGNKTVINVFGDTNQLVYQSIGSNSWSKITKELRSSYYELNENYRNTIQITQYCNKKFGYKHKAIGIEGDKVEIINSSKIAEIIEALSEVYTPDRIAFISKDKEVLDSSSKSIFKGSVADVTGLEFDVVIFNPVNCSNNEMYIGMTRSLQKLYIVE